MQWIACEQCADWFHELLGEQFWAVKTHNKTSGKSQQPPFPQPQITLNAQFLWNICLITFTFCTLKKNPHSLFGKTYDSAYFLGHRSNTYFVLLGFLILLDFNGVAIKDPFFSLVIKGCIKYKCNAGNISLL